MPLLLLLLLPLLLLLLLGGSAAAQDQYFAICLIAKATRPYEHIDIREFVDYHLKIGASVLYMYDDHSPTPFNSTLHDHISTGAVHYTYIEPDPTKNKRKAQFRVYDLCLKHHLPKHTWMGFIDLDEFFVIAPPTPPLVLGKPPLISPAPISPSPTLTIPDILRPYEQYGGLGINLKIFGSSGHVSRPAGGVMGNYRHCHHSALVKTIVHAGRVKGTGGTVHFFKYKPGFYDVDLRRRNITASWNIKGRGERKDRRFSKLFVNHYVIKSWEDYSNKRRRGAPNGDHIRTAAFFNETNAKATTDCGTLTMPM